jgi:hypothetical protein
MAMMILDSAVIQVLDMTTCVGMNFQFDCGVRTT